MREQESWGEHVSVRAEHVSKVASERVELGGLVFVWGYVGLEGRGRLGLGESQGGEMSDFSCVVVVWLG